MNEKFAELVDSLQPKLDLLLTMQPLRYGTLPRDMPTSGVYLFSENGKHLYVGRSNVLRDCHSRHCRPGAKHNQASFAFLLARKTTGRISASYQKDENSRAGLMLNPEFVSAFDTAKDRIRAMEYRYVEESDQNRQMLLQIYCVVTLDTLYNDFGTH